MLCPGEYASKHIREGEDYQACGAYCILSYAPITS